MINSFIRQIRNYSNNMYWVTTAALLIVAIVSSIEHGAFPTNLLIAVITASVTDLAIKKLWLKKRYEIPLSAIIAGLIIGSVSMSAPAVGVFIATLLAIGSKFVIRLKGRHVFNPAVFGVVLSQILIPSAHGPVQETVSHATSAVAGGFGPGGFAVSLIVVPLLLFANYKAKKLWTSIPFLFTTALIFYFTGLVSLGSFNTQDIAKFLEALPYFFAFIILSEPKTSPYAKREQVIFGVSVALLSVLPLFLFDYYSHVVELIVLLLANLLYAIYRIFPKVFSGTVKLKNKKVLLLTFGIALTIIALFFSRELILDKIDIGKLPIHIPKPH